MNQSTTKAWYKQFWPWFLIALPASVVVASIVTIIIASHKPDSIVVDDYYKAGLAINRDLSREQQAEAFNIKGTLHINSDNTGIRVVIDAAEHVRPQQLQVKLTHPTLPDRDQVLTLDRSNNSYSGKITPLAPGAWNVIIESDMPAWRIQHRIVMNRTPGYYRLR